MELSAEQIAEQLVQAVYAAATPGTSRDAQQRAIAVIEAAKQQQPAACILAFHQLFSSGEPQAQLNGLALFRHVVVRSWDSLSSSHREGLLQYVGTCAKESLVQQAAAPVRAQLAYAISDVCIQAGEQTTEQVLSGVVYPLVQSDPVSAYLGCKIIQFLSEGLGENAAARREAGTVGNAAGEAFRNRHRALLATMSRSASQLISLTVQAAVYYLQQASNAAAQMDAGQVSAVNQAAVAACLEALASLVAWMPMKTMQESQLMDVMEQLIQHRDSQVLVLEVMLQLAMRTSKQPSRDQADYGTLFARFGAFLAPAVQHVCSSSIQTSALLEEPGHLERATRACEVLVEFVQGGHLSRAQREAQLGMLKELAAFMGSDYLPLAALTLPAWRRFLQRGCKGGKGGLADTEVVVTGEVLTVVMTNALKLLDVVVGPCDDENLLPAYADSLVDWKDACSSCKSPLKFILNEAADREPLTAVQLLLGAAQSASSDAVAIASNSPAGAADKVVHELEVLAFALESMLATICRAAASHPLASQLEALIRLLLPLRPRSPTALARVGKLLEAIAPALSIAPALAQDLVDAFLAPQATPVSIVMTLHGLRGGPAGNNALAPFLKDQRQLTKCFSTLVAKAPAAFVPCLSHVAERTMALVADGVLGDADRNIIFEGILGSAASQDLDLFSRVLRVLLTPARESWERLGGLLAGEVEMATQFLAPVQRDGMGEVRIGGGAQRLALYHSLQLLMFCARQAKLVANGGGGEALVEHMEWMLLPALSFFRCLVGLSTPQMINGHLKDFPSVLELSPLEKAACLGAQAFMEAKHRVEELEPGRMDPASVHSLRGWIRQCKELAMMLMTEVAMLVPSFWRDDRLCRAVHVDLLYAFEFQEPRSMRLVLHHGVLPLVRGCPREHAARWMPAVLSTALKVTDGRLRAAWVALQQQAGAAAARTKQTEEEIVQEVLLRELSRDVVELLRAFVGSTSFPAVPQASAASNGPTSDGAVAPGGAASGADQYGAPLNSAPWEKTIASALLPEHSGILRDALDLSACAMSWPDTQTQLRAIAFCRTVAVAGGVPLNPGRQAAAVADMVVAQLVVPTVLPAAVRALASISEAHGLSEVLLLIRSILLSCAVWEPSPGGALMELFPGLPQAQVTQLYGQLEANKTEKHHKDTLRAFFVHLGLSNLDLVADLKPASTPQIGNAAVEAPVMQNQSAPVVWPDLFEINIPT